MPSVMAGIAVILIGFQFALMPSIVPFFLCLMYSFWIPQIWRNARRGSTDAMDKTFILGTSVGRLALPLCEIMLCPMSQADRSDVFGYKENVFFTTTTKWVLGLVAWQAVQVVIMIAQERFGAAFL